MNKQIGRSRCPWSRWHCRWHSQTTSAPGQCLTTSSSWCSSKSANSLSEKPGCRYYVSNRWRGVKLTQNNLTGFKWASLELWLLTLPLACDMALQAVGQEKICVLLVNCFVILTTLKSQLLTKILTRLHKEWRSAAGDQVGPYLWLTCVHWASSVFTHIGIQREGAADLGPGVLRVEDRCSDWWRQITQVHLKLLLRYGPPYITHTPWTKACHMTMVKVNGTRMYSTCREDTKKFKAQGKYVKFFGTRKVIIENSSSICHSNRKYQKRMKMHIYITQINLWVLKSTF